MTVIDREWCDSGPGHGEKTTADEGSSLMTLLTLDEARAEVSSSVTRSSTRRAVWARAQWTGLSEADNTLALRHRAVLDNIIALGY